MLGKSKPQVILFTHGITRSSANRSILKLQDVLHHTCITNCEEHWGKFDHLILPFPPGLIQFFSAQYCKQCYWLCWCLVSLQHVQQPLLNFHPPAVPNSQKIGSRSIQCKGFPLWCSHKCSCCFRSGAFSCFHPLLSPMDSQTFGFVTPQPWGEPTNS